MIKRPVDTQFWVDDKNAEMTIEDRYAFLYFLTNPHSTQLGIYLLTVRQMAFDTGFTSERCEEIILSFVTRDIIKYNNETKEIAIKNYLKHSVVKGGGRVEECLKREIRKVKDKTLIDWVFSHLLKCDSINASVLKVIEDYYFYQNSTLQEVIDKWNKLNIKQAEVSSELDSKCREVGYDRVFEAIEEAKKSTWIAGKKTKWRATLNWLLANIDKVLAGDYRDFAVDCKTKKGQAVEIEPVDPEVKKVLESIVVKRKC